MKPIVLTSAPNGILASKWNVFLANTRWTTHYVTPNYFTDAYVRGKSYAVLIEDDNGRIVAASTGIVEGKRVLSGLFSRPQTIFSDGVDRSDIATALLDGIYQLCERPEIIELYAWQETPELSDSGMQVRTSTDETSVVMIDLARGADAIFADFSQTRRNEIRKAIRRNIVEVKELETESELAELFKISRDWNARKGTPAGSAAQMELAAQQRENRRIFIAKTQGRVVAGSFYRFARGGIVEYAANFSDPEYHNLRPNDLIGWHAFQWACENQFSYFSMGGSHLFLRRFGGTIIKTYQYRQSRFHLSDLRDGVLALGARAYHRLPGTIHAGIRTVRAQI